MVQQRQPTKRTRYMEVKYFVVSDWLEKDLIAVMTIPTRRMYQMHLQSRHRETYFIDIMID